MTIGYLDPKARISESSMICRIPTQICYGWNVSYLGVGGCVILGRIKEYTICIVRVGTLIQLNLIFPFDLLNP